MHKRRARSWTLLTVSAVAALAMLAACGTSTNSEGNSSSGDGASNFAGKTLTVACWQSYGCDDPAILKGFKKQTGANVKLVYFTSEDGLLQMLRQGGTGKIDVALPNLEYTVKGYNEGLFEPIDTSKISTWNQILPKLRSVDAVTYQNNVIAVPWMTGETSLVVNPKDVNPIPHSWSVLWDAASKGKVGFFDDPTTAIMTAALYLGEDPQNPDIDKVKQALLALKNNTRVIWSSGDEWNKAYMSGSVTMGNLWSSQAVKLNQTGHPIQYIVPKEGTVAWVDAWTVVKGTSQPDLADAWIQYLTSKDAYLAWSLEDNPDNTPPLSTNKTAFDALPAKYKRRHPDSGIFTDPGKIAFQEGISTEKLDEWTQAWQAVKAG